MTFLLPVYARRLLEGEHLEVAEAEAQRLGVRLRDRPVAGWRRAMREDRNALESMLAAAESDVGRLGEVVAHLHQLTVAGAIDLRLEESAGAWLWLIAKLLLATPHVAALAARRWYSAIIVASMDLGDSIPDRAFVAYLAGVISAHAGEDAKAERHLMSGQVEAEAADEDETGPFLQATRWVRAVLRQRSDPVCAPR